MFLFLKVIFYDDGFFIRNVCKFVLISYCNEIENIGNS